MDDVPLVVGEGPVACLEDDGGVVRRSPGTVPSGPGFVPVELVERRVAGTAVRPGAPVICQRENLQGLHDQGRPVPGRCVEKPAVAEQWQGDGGLLFGDLPAAAAGRADQEHGTDPRGDWREVREVGGH